MMLPSPLLLFAGLGDLALECLDLAPLIRSTSSSTSMTFLVLEKFMRWREGLARAPCLFP